jgi:Domain of unknown function (DUF4262)
MADVTDRVAAADRKIIHDVNTHGWHVMKIMPEGDDPGWAFTIGLFRTFGHPEVVVFGLESGAMHAILNSVGELVRAGTVLSDGSETGEVLERYRCRFRSVDRFWYPYVLGYATWFYGGSEFPAVQLFWPDKLHRYPWEPAFETSLFKNEPLLFKSDPREARAEALLGSAGGDE